MADGILTIDHRAQFFGPGIDSANRLEAMLVALGAERRRRWATGDYSKDWFWEPFLDGWTSCDCTWPWRNALLNMLRCYHEPRDGSTITLYRGCERDRARGVAWTSNLSVAERFARGHRGLQLKHPVIATARVPARAIFAGPLGDRSEDEYLIDPRGLRVKVRNFEPA